MQGKLFVALFCSEFNFQNTWDVTTSGRKMTWYQLLAAEFSQVCAHLATMIPALQCGGIRCSWDSFHLTAAMASQHPCLLADCCLNHFTSSGGGPLLCVVYKANVGKGTEKSLIIDTSYAWNTCAATAASALEHGSARVGSIRSGPQAAYRERLEGYAARTLQIPLCPPQSIYCKGVDSAPHHLLW